jgi:TonB family protein
MKLAMFFFVSTALHAAALAYPALFLESRAVTPVTVTLLEADGGSHGGNGSTGGGRAPQKKPAPPAPQAAAEKRSAPPAVEPERLAARPEQVVELPQPIAAPPIVVADIPTGLVIAARQSEPAAPGEISVRSGGAGKNIFASNAGGNGIGGGGGTRGSGNGTGGSGLNGIDPGSGDGRGSGNGGSPSASVDVRIAYSPSPDYPKSARQQGWEGTVTLRVLVGEDGQPKSVEVHKTSGFAVLDQAAVETVKSRWRFHPARAGEKPVARRVEFPVDFSLANLRDR